MWRDDFITERQLKKVSKVLKLSGKNFHQAAREAGLKDLPKNVLGLNYEQARQFLKYFGYYFNTKEKQ